MILFDEKKHTYFHTRLNKYLKSVTTRLKDFQKEFREDHFSKLKAQEYETNQEEVLKYWEYLRVVGTMKGSIVHNYLEKRWFGKVADYEAMIPRIIFSLPTYEQLLFLHNLKTCIGYAEQFVQDALERFEPLEAEKIVYNDNYAGQIDLLVYDKKIQDRRIIDYKTDKEIQYFNRFENLAEPFTYLSNCNYNKYCLQTSCYNYLEGLTAPPIIVHINEKNDSYNIIKADLYLDEAKILMT